MAVNFFHQTDSERDREILDEVAAILARGFLRYRSSCVLSTNDRAGPENEAQTFDSPANSREMTLFSGALMP